jgi:hypothetical protein
MKMLNGGITRRLIGESEEGMMGYKLVVECEVCGKEFKVKARKNRREYGWGSDQDTYVSCCFSLMTEEQRLKVEGNLDDSELYFETVCDPCRTVIRDSVKGAISKLSEGALARLRKRARK